jgi:hypothetical protein
MRITSSINVPLLPKKTLTSEMTLSLSAQDSQKLMKWFFGIFLISQMISAFTIAACFSFLVPQILERKFLAPIKVHELEKSHAVIDASLTN